MGEGTYGDVLISHVFNPRHTVFVIAQTPFALALPAAPRAIVDVQFHNYDILGKDSN
jgi:hypothetical protein